MFKALGSGFWSFGFRVLGFEVGLPQDCVLLPCWELGYPKMFLFR